MGLDDHIALGQRIEADLIDPAAGAIVGVVDSYGTHARARCIGKT